MNKKLKVYDVLNNKFNLGYLNIDRMVPFSVYVRRSMFVGTSYSYVGTVNGCKNPGYATQFKKSLFKL